MSECERVCDGRFEADFGAAACGTFSCSESAADDDDEPCSVSSSSSLKCPERDARGVRIKLETCRGKTYERAERAPKFPRGTMRIGHNESSNSNQTNKDASILKTVTLLNDEMHNNFSRAEK